MIDLHIIIVSWNCIEYLKKCLRSIYQYPPNCNYKITVVDNASADGTLETVHSNFPDVYVIKNESNKGFASANNLVLKRRNFRYYLLLNPDTEVYPNAIQELIECAEREADAYGVGPKIVNADGTQQATGVTFPNNCNIFVESLFLDKLFPKSRIFGNHKKLYLDWSALQTVDYLQGSALLIKDEALESVGLLDEGFFLFFEETDWCYRVKKSYKKILYYPKSTIKHYGGGDTAHYNGNKVVYYHKSLFYFYRKHYKYYKIIILCFTIFVRCIVRIFVWICAAVCINSIREKAISALKGYFKVILLLLGGKL